MNLTIAIVLFVASIFLILAVLAQHSKSAGLSGTIAGSAETFFGKDKGTYVDRLLGKLTVIVGIIFVLVVLFVYIAQPDYNQSFSFVNSYWKNASSFLGK